MLMLVDVSTSLTTVAVALAGVLAAECLGVFPAMVLGRQLRQFFALAWTFCGRGAPDSDDDNQHGPSVLRWYSFRSRVWLSDLDFWGHQNNVQYYKRCEEGRFQVLLRSGLQTYMHRHKYTAGLAGCVVRFRRELTPLQNYRVRSRVAGWDERSMYIEHRFVGKDGFVHAHGLSTLKLVRKVTERGVTPYTILSEFEPSSVFSEIQASDGVGALRMLDEWSSKSFTAAKGKEGKGTKEKDKDK